MVVCVSGVRVVFSIIYINILLFYLGIIDRFRLSDFFFYVMMKYVYYVESMSYSDSYGNRNW